VTRIAVTAFGPDRPGIVATLTGVLLGHGANLEDTSMTILQGHFAMMLVVNLPAGEGPAALESTLGREVAGLGLTVVVRPLEGEGRRKAEETATSWAVSVYGSDHPGIVHRVTRLLADAGANITDLSTRVVGEEALPAYVMMLQISLPPGADGGRLGAELAVLGDELGVEVRLRPHDADVL
jgi:glycine cleavage system transcriptional repressor